MSIKVSNKISYLYLILSLMIMILHIYDISDFLLVEKKPYWWMRQMFYYFCVHLAFAEIIRKFYIKIFGTSSISICLSFVILPILLYLVVILSAYLLRLFKPIWYV